jgi:hypothetical protein
VKVEQTGDFNHDGTINQTDRNFFITQFNKTFHGNAPLAVGSNGATISDYVDYIKADVNGSSKPIAGGNGALEAASVTYKDLLVLNQFIEQKTGDLNWDGVLLDSADWAVFSSHYKHAASEFGYTSFSWFDGDVTFDGLVNGDDYLRLVLPADLNYDGFVGIDDLTLLQSHWGQSVLARDAALGDISGDGFVGIDDLTALQSYWGQSVAIPASLGQGFAQLGGAAVPEPSTIALLGAAALAAVFRYRRRK